MNGLINLRRDLDIASALDVERLNFSLPFGTEDQAEGVRAFLEKRNPEFKGR